MAQQLFTLLDVDHVIYKSFSLLVELFGWNLIELDDCNNIIAERGASSKLSCKFVNRTPLLLL